MSKKIQFIHHFMRSGGVERQLYYLANGLAASNQVTVMLCQQEGSFLRFLDDRVKVVNLKTVFKNRLQPRLLQRILKMLSRDRPHVLISFHGSFHWLAVIAGRLMGVKVVCVFHGYLDRGLLWAAQRFFLHHADGLLAVSHSVGSSLMENLKIDADKITVIENGIDASSILQMSAEPLTPLEQRYFGDGSVIVSVGRLAQGKGFSDILRALSGIDKKYTMLIIGEGPEKGRLEEEIHRLGLWGKVHLLGNQVNPYKFLAKASFFVLASETEGLPTVILEAMCLGIPCICARYRGGTRGVIEDRKTGYLVNVNDSDDLRAAIDLFLSAESEAMQKTMVEACRAQMEAKFCMERYISDYQSYLERVVSE